MHCFRVVLDSGGECVPVSPKYPHIEEAIEHADHLAVGLRELLPGPFTILVSEYIDVEGLEYVIRDIPEADFRHHRLPAGMSFFTVIGFYTDNQQPWVTLAVAPDAEAAALEAVRGMMRLNDWGDPDDIRVLDVFRGRCVSTALFQYVAAGREILEKAGVPC